MRHFLLLLGLILSSITFAQKDIEFKKYSFAEFFKMIEDEQSEVFNLKNALILLDTAKDQDFLTTYGSSNSYSKPLRTDTIHINKALRLENVIFDPMESRGSEKVGILHNVVFHNRVAFNNVFGDFQNLVFKSAVTFWFNDTMITMMRSLNPTFTFERFRVINSVFEIDPRIVSLGGIAKDANPMFQISECQFKSNSLSNNAFIIIREFGTVYFEKNTFEGTDPVQFKFMGNNQVNIENNNFGNRWVYMDFPEDNRVVQYIGNNHDYLLGLSLSEATSNISIDWSQFENGIINGAKLEKYLFDDYGGKTDDEIEEQFNRNRDFISKYRDSIRIANSLIYKAEIGLLGTLNGIYKRQHDSESANASYIVLKDLETSRLKYLYGQNPSFDTFFEWKVNQFLKTFSDYGTKPAKAITMSVYVVILFALIYLFFPNYWDSHGKDRILHRYQFFLKYLNRDAGMHDVYLDDKKDELAHYEGFRLFFEENGKTVPKFFLATALPLYRWSTASTKGTSWFLQKIDIFRGKWSDLPPAQRAFKTILLVVVFLVAILYDIFIKILNALMLSINTFTTLGFGEIPIKGLPRYLAIIQGFIGWFMLTIFSVSLISQLLN